MSKYDVTVSVWNVFHSRELIAGLAAKGLRVRSLGTSRSMPGALRHDFAVLPSLLTKAFQRTQRPYLLEAAQSNFERFAASRVHDTQCFWGWSGHHLRAFRKARSQDVPIIVECGSTHTKWSSRRLHEDGVKNDFISGPLETSSRQEQAIIEYELADYIAVPSKFVHRTFLENGIPAKKLLVNPYGVDTEFWSQAERCNEIEDKLIFIFAASVTPRKGAHYLLQAWKRAALQNAELWICGGVFLPLDKVCGPLPDSIKILGCQTHTGLRGLYSSAHVYVLPSLEEGMARSGLEAMAAGLPAIITEETGLTDVLTHGQQGWVVESANIDALAEQLRWCNLRRDEVVSTAAKAREAGQAMTFEAYGNRAYASLRHILSGDHPSE